MKLTFGFSYSSDPGGWYALNAFKMHHRRLLDRAEILIVDNSPPGCPISDEFAGHVRANHKEVRYIRDDGPPSSCLYKDRLFREATGDVVVCVDAHVLLEAGSVDAILKYFEDNPGSRDLLMGTLQNAAGRVMATNQMLYEWEDYQVPQSAAVRHGIVCRGGQLGVWVTDPRGLDRDGQPYEIQTNGTWLLAMRREAWPGFHPAMYGFGGNEPYIMEKIRAAGGKVLNHPAIRGTHNFSAAHGRGYKPLAEDKVRNYLVAALDLGRMDHYNAAIEHFGTVHPNSIAKAVADAEKVMKGGFAPKPHQPKKQCGGNGACKSKTADAKPKSPDIYQRYIDQWKATSGDGENLIPRSLFIQIVHTKASTSPDGNGKPHPVRTLEFGCGLSTLGYDRQKVIHTAVSHDREIIDRLNTQIKNGQTTLVHAPLKNGWYDWTPPYGMLHDVILIDAPHGVTDRAACVESIKHLLAPGGVIYVRGTQREAEQRLAADIAAKMEMKAVRRAEGGQYYDVLTPLPEPLGEGPGTELMTFMKSLPKMPTCQLCHNLARKMNKWGVAGCRENEDDIVEDMLGRARAWWKNSSPWMKAEAWFAGQGSVWDKLTSARKVAALDIDKALRESIRRHVRAAVDGYEARLLAGETEEAKLLDKHFPGWRNEDPKVVRKWKEAWNAAA